MKGEQRLYIMLYDDIYPILQLVGQTEGYAAYAEVVDALVNFSQMYNDLGKLGDPVRDNPFLGDRDRRASFTAFQVYAAKFVSSVEHAQEVSRARSHKKTTPTTEGGEEAETRTAQMETSTDPAQPERTMAEAAPANISLTTHAPRDPLARFRRTLPADLIDHALTLARDHAAGSPEAYAATTLDRWQAEGITTLDAARAAGATTTAANPALNYSQHKYTDADFAGLYVDLG